MQKIKQAKQGSRQVKGPVYEVYQCNNCKTLVPYQEEVLCWDCGTGQMIFIGTIIVPTGRNGNG